jgi:hypothetical protein
MATAVPGANSLERRGFEPPRAALVYFLDVEFKK